MDFKSQFRAIINEPNYTNDAMRSSISVPINLQEALICSSVDEIEEILRESYDLTLSAQNDWELRCRQIVDICLEQEINVNMLGTVYSALLHFVIENIYEDFESVFFRCKDFDINALSTYKKSRFGTALLHLAVKRGRKKVVKVLLKFGADVDVRDSSLQTPLFFAIYNEENELAEMLLKAGANVNAKDKWGGTPINAVFFNNTSFNGNDRKLYRSNLIKLLCEYGADLNFQNSNGAFTLLRACENGDLSEVQFFIEHGADLFATDNFGYTAIHYAARGNHYDTIDFLLQNGVDVDAQNDDNVTPVYDLARAINRIYLPISCFEYDDPDVISTIWDSEYEVKLMKQSANMIEFLADNGADVNTLDYRNFTPLLESVQLNSLEIVECLLELKADVDNLKDSFSFLLQYYFIDNLVIHCNPEFRVNTDFYADRINAWQLLTAFLATKDCDISVYCEANSTNFEWVHPFFEQCKTEVNRMKERTICENRSVTFFDFLTKDLMDVLQFCRNREVMTVLESVKHKEEFRLYKYLFERRMERVENLQNCENAFRRFLDKYFKNKLPLVVVDEIVSYLTAGNLRNFGRALCISKDFPDGNFHYTEY